MDFLKIFILANIAKVSDFFVECAKAFVLREYIFLYKGGSEFLFMENIKIIDFFIK